MISVKNQNKFTLLFVAGILLLSSGCMSPAVRSKGIVAWNYKSLSTQATQNKKDQIPVSIRINNFQEDAPSNEFGGASGLLRILPIFTLIAPPIKFTNQLPDGSVSQVGLKPGELEKILADEISKSGIVKKISLSDIGGDYEINGQVKLSFEMKRHCSGLGIFYMMSVAPMLLFPGDAQYFKCEARFDVISAKSGTIILSKDYIAESRWQCWPFYNQARLWSCYGEEVFPKIVEQFMTDLKALPRSSWPK